MENTFLYDTYFKDFIKIVKVNCQTGDYEVIKTFSDGIEDSCLAAKNIVDYVDLLCENGLINPSDAQSFDRFVSLLSSDANYLKAGAHIYCYVNYLIKNSIEWAVAEITTPEDFSESNPYALLTIKYMDEDNRLFEDSMKMLNSMFHKILKVDLINDTYEEIKVYPNEKNAMNGYSESAFQWAKDFAILGNVHPADIADYFVFVSRDNIIKSIKSSSDCLRYKYRRKIGGVFKWVVMEIVPTMDYFYGSKNVMIFIRDIHDEYVADLEKQKELEYYCNTDIATGLANRYCYTRICKAFETMNEKGAISVLFADINGLKYINDHYGHDEGDKHIKRFVDILVSVFGIDKCYRLSGDEFIVLDMTYSEVEFMVKYQKLYELLRANGDFPIASIGYVYEKKPTSIDKCVQEAEHAMYNDKKLFYQQYKKFERRS